VVVFSQLSDRDVPSVCLGGDLDGDDFFVIWDLDLLPREWNVPLMDYTSRAPMTLDRPMNIDDVMSFIVKYTRSNSLPTIAYARLAESDYLNLSKRDLTCKFTLLFRIPMCTERLTFLGLTLAALHSKAVDFVKTSVPVEMPKYLRPRI
jgi:RNA-dependent RNA polymerase